MLVKWSITQTYRTNLTYRWEPDDCIMDKNLFTIPMVNFAWKIIVPVLEFTKITRSLISVEMSRDGKAKPSGQSLGDMFTYAKAYMIPRLMIEFWTLFKPGPSTKSWAQP